MNNVFKMKNAVVTGGTKGIGKQVVIDLLKRGYRVWTNYASDDSAAEFARKEFAILGECVVAKTSWGGATHTR